MDDDDGVDLSEYTETEWPRAIIPKKNVPGKFDVKDEPVRVSNWRAHRDADEAEFARIISESMDHLYDQLPDIEREA